MALKILIQERVWLDKAKYTDAERVFHEKLSKEKSKETNTFTAQNVLADICEPKNLKIQSLKKIKISKSESRKTSQSNNFSFSDQITKYHDCSNFNELLSSVEQWDIKTPNQYKKINKFVCFVCNFLTEQFNEWKTHIMSISHVSVCQKAKNLYSYVCSYKECKNVLYGPEKLIIAHKTWHSELDTITGVPILMAEVMKRFISKQNSIYYCSHCKIFKENPIHSDIEKSNINIKCPVAYYCKYCKVNFYSSPEMIDYHSLSVEHMTLKCFEMLCLKAKMNSEKTFEQSNENKEKNSLPTVKKEIIDDSIPLLNVQEMNSLFNDGDSIEVEVNKNIADVNVCFNTPLDQNSQKLPLSAWLENSDINVHNSKSQSYDNTVLNFIQKKHYERYLKHKIDILNVLRKYKNYMKTLAFYCNECDFVTEEKYIWDHHTETKHLNATNRITVHCSTCSMMIVGGTYEEHLHTDQHSILLEFEGLLEPVVNNLVKNTEFLKLDDTSKLEEMPVDSEQNKAFNLYEINNTEAKTLDDLNSKNNDCNLNIESNSKSKDLTITNTLSPDKSYDHNKCIQSEEVLNSVNSKTTANEIVDEKSPLKVPSGEIASGYITNFEKKNADKFDEDKTYGEYVTNRLKQIQNATVKQNIQLEIDYLFYTKMKKMLQKNA